MIKYHILTLFENSIDLSNGLEEILRERISRYKKMSIPLDFWLFKDFNIENYLIKNENSFSKSYILVTTNQVFLNWLKLRYGYFQELNKSELILSQAKSEITLDGYYLSSTNPKTIFSNKSLFY